MHRLPGRIAFVMGCMILVFALSFAIFTMWTGRTLDQEAIAWTRGAVRHGLSDAIDQISSMGLDYAKWPEAARAAERGDVEWLTDNVGSSAMTGEAFQKVVLWGGPLAQDLGWADDRPEPAQPGLLTAAQRAAAERALVGVPMNSYAGRTYFLRDDDGTYAVSVARVEGVVGAPDFEPAGPGGVAIQLMALRIDPALLGEIASAFGVHGIHLGDLAAIGPDQNATALPGADGRPVAYVIWDAPDLDERLVASVLPAAGLVAAIVLGLSLLCFRLVNRDAQALARAESEASAAARTDAMTGLPNRLAFTQALAQPTRAGERAVLFLDINGFKRINDSIGHEAGDAAIVAVSRRLGRLVGPGTLLARIAGDEFVFIIDGPEAQARTEALADEVDAALADTFSILGHQMTIRLAKGYAVQTESTMSGEDLVRQADLAMYVAKRNPDQGLVPFSAVIAQATQDAALIEQELRHALAERDQLHVAYQPIVGRAGQLVRVEALARWTSPRLGAVPPGRFIAVAEQAGLIVELGRHLMQLICADLVAHPGLRVAVNISPLQLMAPDFVPAMVGELRHHGIDPARIEIELTEAVVVDDSRLAAERLMELQAAGFSTALDDFGTGYSSIGYLRQMNFNVLKIDRSFVSDAASTPRVLSLLRNMIDLAHGLELQVVCEGVETDDELALVRRLGCDLVQGYHLGRPMPIRALVERWLPCLNGTTSAA